MKKSEPLLRHLIFFFFMTLLSIGQIVQLADADPMYTPKGVFITYLPALFVLITFLVWIIYNQVKIEGKIVGKCPYLSFTDLKWSKSNRIKDKGSLKFLQRFISELKKSIIYFLLNIPVKPSKFAKL